jgi:hypothetical protein
MLQFKQDDTTAVMILTLTELVTLTVPYYLFMFTHVETKNMVVFVKSVADDESDYPQRYNQFTIDAADVFEDQPTGEWHYKVYEQASSTNVDLALAGGILEEGKLILERATEFSYSMYDQNTSYKAYNGQ